MAKTMVLARGTKAEHKDVLFMFKPDDFRLTDERWVGEYVVLGEGVHDRRQHTLTVDGEVYTVHGDWSLTPGRARRFTMADHRAMERG